MKIPLKYNTEYAFLTKDFEIYLLKIHEISYQANLVSVAFGITKSLTENDLLWIEFTVDDFNEACADLLGEL